MGLLEVILFGPSTVSGGGGSVVQYASLASSSSSIKHSSPTLFEAMHTEERFQSVRLWFLNSAKASPKQKLLSVAGGWASNSGVGVGGGEEGEPEKKSESGGRKKESAGGEASSSERNSKQQVDRCCEAAAEAYLTERQFVGILRQLGEFGEAEALELFDIFGTFLVPNLFVC